MADVRDPEHADTTPQIDVDPSGRIYIDGHAVGDVSPLAVPALLRALAASPDTPGENPYPTPEFVAGTVLPNRAGDVAVVQARAVHRAWDEGYAAGLAAGRAATEDTLEDDEVSRAIAVVENSRSTHVEWIEHLAAHESCPDAEVAGSAEDHQRAVDGYDLVLSVLRRAAATGDTDPPPSDDTTPDDLADRLWTAATNGNADTFDETYEQVLGLAGTHDTAVVDLQALTEVVATLKEVATRERWHEGSRGWRIIHEMDRAQRAGATRAYSAVIARRASGDHPTSPGRPSSEETTP